MAGREDVDKQLPTPQNAIDIFKGSWINDLSDALPGVIAGSFKAFSPEDRRPAFVAEHLGRGGSLEGMKILELGPLEAGHTWQLEQRGASDIVAVEGNPDSFLRCLLVKELLGMRARFQFGDFVSFLERQAADRQRYDLVMASGVLYHMIDPLLLIALLARLTDRCFVWTHYHAEGVVAPTRVPRRGERDGFAATYWVLPRRRFRPPPVLKAWLAREEMLAAFRHFGFDELTVLAEAPGGPAPHFSFAARRARAD